MHCTEFGGYLLNNWTGLASLWSNMHLRDQKKHCKEKPYLEWSKAFSEKACLINPPRTQDIIEVHQKITKHITLASKKQRVDSFIIIIIITNIYTGLFISCMVYTYIHLNIQYLHCYL